MSAVPPRCCNSSAASNTHPQPLNPSPLPSSTINPAASTGGKKHKRKKKKKGKKKGGKGGKGAASDAAADEDEDDEEELTYDEIARRIPQLKLSTLLAAEKQFLEADADHSGHIDAG